MDNAKKKAAISVAAAAAFVALAAVVALAIKKNMPSRERMSLYDYFDVGQGGLKVILQDKASDVPGLYEDGRAYIEAGVVKDVLNSRFYWDDVENKLLYTTPSAVISAEVNSSVCLVNKAREEKDYIIVKVKDGSVYIALDYIKEHTALDYKKYDNPDRVVIDYVYGEDFSYAFAKKSTKLRYGASIKSAILRDIEEGEKLLELEQDSSSDGFLKVMSKDGVTGYVQSKKIGKKVKSALKTDFEEESYTHILFDEKISLAWHQVTNASANGELADKISAAKGVDVVSPTWFKTADDSGGISSIADYSYVERAHASGVQVWALCDDFDPGMKIGNVLEATSKRQRLAKNLIAEAIRYSLDGINIDFENVKKENGEDFIQFVRELGIMCRSNGIVLSIDNYVPTEYTQYYDIEEQAKVADYVIIMAYDEYFAGSDAAGPVASLGFVKDAAANAIKQAPPSQTIIALPFYSRIWTEKTENGKSSISSEACSMEYAEAFAKDSGVDAVWDEEAGLDYVEFNEGKVLRRAWIENSKSLDLKMKAVSETDAAGMAFWKLGLETPSIWDVIAKYGG